MAKRDFSCSCNINSFTKRNYPLPSGGAPRNPHQPYGPIITAPALVNENNGAGYASSTVRLIVGWFAESKPSPEITLKQRLQAINSLNNKKFGNEGMPPMERITTDYDNLTGSDLAAVSQRLRENKHSGNDLLIAAALKKANRMYEVNQKHEGGDLDASMLPENHTELWDNRGYYDASGDTWWAKEGEGKKAVYHQFMGKNGGSYHWAGSTGENYNRKGQKVKPISPNNVPVEIKRK